MKPDSASNGSVTAWSGAAYSYDGLNRLSAKSDRDAALTYFYYDAAGNVTNRVMPGSLKWQAVYNNASQMLQDHIQRQFTLKSSARGARP